MGICCVVLLAWNSGRLFLASGAAPETLNLSHIPDTYNLEISVPNATFQVKVICEKLQSDFNLDLPQVPVSFSSVL